MSLILDTVGSYRVQYPSAGIDSQVENLTPNQIKAELATHYRELANATVSVNGNVVTFAVPSGQKN